MAHKKAQGSTGLGRDSQSQRLGVKLFAGEQAHSGAIIIRQRGTKFHPGINVARGKDDTLFAKADGVIRFRSLKRKKFDNQIKLTTYVDVIKKTAK